MPTVTTLWKIATGLKAPLSFFLEAPQAEYTVVGPEPSKVILGDGGVEEHIFVLHGALKLVLGKKRWMPANSYDNAENPKTICSALRANCAACFDYMDSVGKPYSDGKPVLLFPRSRDNGGNGLGLYIVDTILKVLEIPYSFEPMNSQNGMRFSIQIPANSFQNNNGTF